MESTYFIPAFLLLLLVIITSRRRRMTVARRIIQRRNLNSKEKEQMTELAKKFIGKKCMIYSLNDNQITGVIKEVSDGALLIEKDGNLQAVNLDFIVRIREYPTKKNGKEKSVILD